MTIQLRKFEVPYFDISNIDRERDRIKVTLENGTELFFMKSARWLGWLEVDFERSSPEFTQRLAEAVAGRIGFRSEDDFQELVKQNLSIVGAGIELWVPALIWSPKPYAWPRPSVVPLREGDDLVVEAFVTSSTSTLTVGVIKAIEVIQLPA